MNVDTNDINRFSLGFENLHHGYIRIQNCGFYSVDPPRGLGVGESEGTPKCALK